MSMGTMDIVVIPAVTSGRVVEAVIVDMPADPRIRNKSIGHMSDQLVTRRSIRGPLLMNVCDRLQTECRNTATSNCGDVDVRL